MKYILVCLGFLLLNLSLSAQVPSLNVIPDLKSRKWSSAENFTSKTLADQKEIHMSIYNDEMSKAKTPVMWIEGEDLIIRYPDGYVTKMEYSAPSTGYGIIMYPMGKEGKALQYEAIYISTGSFFTLYIPKRK